MSILANLKARGLRDILNPRKWRAFLQKPPSDEEVTFEYCEQVVYRSILCRPCINAGECHHCHCEMPGAVLAKDNFCSMDKWQEMMSDEQWREYKKVSNLKFKLDYDN